VRLELTRGALLQRFICLIFGSLALSIQYNIALLKTVVQFLNDEQNDFK